MLGTVLGRFRIEAKLGEGGMGVVWRAHDPQLARDVALKVLPDALVADSRARARLVQEARAAAALNHPNILAVHDVGEAGGHVYLALEYVPGRSLAVRLADGPLPPAEVVRLGTQVAAGLAHAHARGIVHRDVKPSNVLETPAGQVKLLDFGLATRAVAEGDPTRSFGLTEPGALVGTPSAMAPELWRGAPADARSDVWAMGVLLHSLLSGRAPFAGTTTYELSAAIRSGPPAPLPASVPAELRAVIERCLARDPAGRYASAGELHAALLALERPAGSGPGARPRRGARIGVVVLAGFALLVALAVAILVWRPWGAPAPAARIASLAVLPLENFSRDPEQQYFSDGMTDELITRLAQMGIVRVISRTSVMRFRGTTLPLPRIARELGVEAVIEGSVLRSGGRVRITAQLVRAATDEHLWARSYEREVGDALALQDEVAAAIADEVRGALAAKSPHGAAGPVGAPLAGAAGAPPHPGTATTPVAPGTGGTRAAAVIENYLRGRSSYQRWTTPDERQAVAWFDRALALDSTFAPAVAARASALNLISLAPETTAMARAGIEHALALDPDLGEAHAARAKFLFEMDWDWAGAEREFRRAIALNPNDADAHHQYSHLLGALGRMREAREQAEIMLALDPLSPAAHDHMGWMYAQEGDYPAAEAACAKALELDPGYRSALELVADFRMAERRWSAYRETIARRRRAGDAMDPLLDTLAIAMERGRREEAIRLARRMASPADAYAHSWTELARWFALAGARDDAFSALDSARAVRDYTLLFANTDGAFASLRGDGRYAALRRRMGLPR